VFLKKSGAKRKPIVILIVVVSDVQLQKKSKNATTPLKKNAKIDSSTNPHRVLFCKALAQENKLT
jgi:hypothetical protein